MSYNPPPAMRGLLPRGTRLNDNYEIDAFLKAGGMGEVYRGREIQTGDFVAIKVIRDDLAGDASVFGMFRKEAQALRRIYHPAVVRYFGFAQEPALRRHYLAMEFVEGAPLQELIAREPLRVEDALALARRLASGFQAAHDEDVVHRDVSPDNIIVPRAGLAYARIIDFGIARSLRGGDGTIVGGGFAGKYNYVSPEQLGLFGGDVRAASDIYSLGLVLAQCLLGRPIDMDGTPADVLDKRRRVPDLSGVDPRIRPLLDHMLQPDPAARPGSMAEVAAWRGGGARRRWPALAGRAAAGAVLVALVAGGGYWAQSHFFRDRIETAAVAPPPPEPPAGEERAIIAPPPLVSADPFVRIREFARDFAGGDCFLALVTKISAEGVEIEGLGRARDGFDALDHAFPGEIGLRAAIDLRRISAAQCPALAFARRFLATDESVRLEAPAAPLRRDAESRVALEGAVETQAANVQLYLIDDEGLVSDVSGYLAPAPGRREFHIGLRPSKTAKPGALPVVLLAVASAAPLPAGGARRAQAAEWFARLARQCAELSPPPAVAVKFVSMAP